MKYKRYYFFGGEKKDKDASEDWVDHYIAENGKRINCCYGFYVTDKWYEVDGRTFSTLKEAKEYCEAKELTIGRKYWSAQYHRYLWYKGKSRTGKYYDFIDVCDYHVLLDDKQLRKLKAM